MRYKKKEGLYDAIQWTGRNLLDVWDFCDSITLRKSRGHNEGDPTLKITVDTITNYGDILEVGQFLVKRKDNNYLVYDEDGFKETFFGIDEDARFTGEGLS